MAAVYRTNTATERDVYSHLVECDGNFTPPLSSRVELRAYAKKIATKAVTFEAWEGDVLAGLVAAYFTDRTAGKGYITDVSIVSGCMGKGIAATLLDRCIAYAEKCGYTRIDLEVSADNDRAIRLYQKRGFVTVEDGPMRKMAYRTGR